MSLTAAAPDIRFGRRLSRFADRRFRYLLVWPAILILLFVGIFPFINILVVSFQDITLLAEDRSFHGAMNYTRLFRDGP